MPRMKEKYSLWMLCAPIHKFIDQLPTNKKKVEKPTSNVDCFDKEDDWQAKQSHTRKSI